MSRLWIDIERLVLDGVALDPVKANRLTALTQIALERLLRERGVAAGLHANEPAQARTPQPDRATGPSPTAEERWADEIAHVICRAIDRSV